MATENEELLQRIYCSAADSFALGKSRSAVVEDLVSQGVPVDAAHVVTDQVHRMKKAAFRKEGLKTIAIGIGLIALGAAITGITYSMASNGGHYLATTGLFLVGGITVLKGLWRTAVG